MRNKLLIGLICILLAGNFHAMEYEEIFSASDNTFFPEQCKFDFSMTDYENNQVKRFYLFNGTIKGGNRYLIIGRKPDAVVGLVQLRIDDVIYVYMRRIDKMSQVSAKVDFFNSDFSQEDIMNTKLTNFYDLENLEVVKENGRECYKLNLKSKSNQVAYFRIISIIDKETFKPIRREYYSFSNQKIKEMVIDEMVFREDGRINSIKLTMYNSLRNSVHTVVEFSNIDYSEVEDRFFTKMYMRSVAR